MENRPLNNPAPRPHENPENPSRNEDESLSQIEALLEKIRLQQKQIEALQRYPPSGRQIGTGDDPEAVTSPTQHFVCTKYPPCNSSFATNENLEQHLKEHIDQGDLESHRRMIQHENENERLSSRGNVFARRMIQQASICESVEMHMQDVHAHEQFQSSSLEDMSPSHPQIKSDKPGNWQPDPSITNIKKNDCEYGHDFPLWPGPCPEPEYSKASHSHNEKDFDPRLCSRPDQAVENAPAFNLDNINIDFDSFFLSRNETDDVFKSVYDASRSPGDLNQMDGQAMSFSWLDEQPNSDPWANWGRTYDDQRTNQPFNEPSTQEDFNWNSYTAPARSPSVASFGSANSGVSHPPRTNRTRRKKRVSMSYNDLVNGPEAGNISRVEEWTSSVRSPTRRTEDGFPCEICERRFKYRKDLERHVFAVHERVGYWFCPILECRYATQGFRRKERALRHVKIHLKNSEEPLEPIFRP